MSTKHFQKNKRDNPALAQAKLERRIKQGMEEARANGIEYATLVYNLISILVLGDKLLFTDDQMETYLKGMESYSDCITNGYMTIPGIIDALREEYNVQIDYDKLIKWYPQIEGYLKPESEEK